MKDCLFFDFEGVIANSYILISGIATVITALAEKNTLIIVSSSSSQVITDFLRIHNLDTCFKEIIGGDTAGSKSEKIKKLLSSYHLNVSDCIFITDTLRDIREVSSINIKTIAVIWGFDSLELLEKGSPWQIVNSPDELLTTIQNSYS